ncbi:MAG: hypothetical protein ABIH36_03320 [bacterium]
MKAPAAVFLHEHCECGGKIYRHWTQYHSGGDWDEVIVTEVGDRCVKCERIHAASRNVRTPCREIGRLFDKWNEDMLSREDFDQEIARVLRQAGGSWETKKVS